MIDLHCHILPGIDDGAKDMATALNMARIAVADGIGTIACTPHILPGVYNNWSEQIRQAMLMLADKLEAADIPLQLTLGADVHLAPDLIARLREGSAPTLAGSRYFLLEPPHHSVPPRLADFAFRLVTAGYTPILTHPERLAWIETHYALIEQLSFGGVLMQVTGGSFTGAFGRQSRYWAERLLDEGLIDFVASDAHDVKKRPPRLSDAREAIAKRRDEETASRLVANTPLLILQNVLPSKLRQP